MPSAETGTVMLGRAGSLVERTSNPLTGPIAVAVKATCSSTYCPAAIGGITVGVANRSVEGFGPPHVYWT